MEIKLCVECKKEISPDIPFCPYCGAKQNNLSESDFEKDPFEILQISHEAEREVVEAAFKSLAKKYHPDIDKTETAQEKMKEINWAYGILKDDKKRKEWITRNPAPKTPTQRTQTKPQSEEKPKRHQKDRERCPNCGKVYLAEMTECPYCKKDSLEKSKAKKKKGLTISATLFILSGFFIVCPLLWFYGDSLVAGIGGIQNSSSQALPTMKRDVPTSTIRPTLRPTPTRRIFPTVSSIYSNSTQNDCTPWRQVGSKYIGDQLCVYGNIAKINHNDYGNGFYEYVVRFVNSNDHFLVKSENYWWPDLKVGQCWYFEGVIQYNGTYFFMKVVSGNDVEGGIYSGCN
jgi:uncharacterized OB-fold protein